MSDKLTTARFDATTGERLPDEQPKASEPEKPATITDEQPKASAKGGK